MPYPVRLQVTKLTTPDLISAPAGYGKTTLAAGWAGQRGCRAAWLALDEADDDPLLFLSYLPAAPQRVAHDQLFLV